MRQRGTTTAEDTTQAKAGESISERTYAVDLTEDELRALVEFLYRRYRTLSVTNTLGKLQTVLRRVEQIR